MLDSSVKALADGKNYAIITTLLPGGQPNTHIVWVDADDEHVLINTEVARQKFLNIKRDPRVTVLILDAGNPYHFAEVRGRVVGTVTGAEAREHIDRLSNKYNGAPYSAPIKSERVILQIEPEHVRSQG